MLELLIVRHGMSVRNHYTDLAFEGDTTLLDLHLEEGKDEVTWPLWMDGEEQARSTGEWLRKTHGNEFAGTYTSPFLRAHQTAELLGIEGADWVLDERIRERFWGEYGPETDPPYTTQEYMADIHRCGQPTWRTRLPGGEAVIDLYPPAKAFVEDLIATVPTGKVLVVTHGGTMRALQMVIENLPPERPELVPKIKTENCSILHYRLTDFSEDRTTWTATRDILTPWCDLV